MPRRATITLYIDPAAFRDETGARLTKAALDKIGKDISTRMPPHTCFGYEGWETKFVNLPDRRTR